MNWKEKMYLKTSKEMVGFFMSLITTVALIYISPDRGKSKA
jgi:hypothetical protein